MFEKCPGQSTRNLKVGIYKCSYCAQEVEIFSDEFRVKCPKCKKFVFKDKIPSCIEWCKSARECIGAERWDKVKDILKENKNGIKRK
ncbi:MAG: phosphohydrolase [Elusimicrobia bacterium]|nr:phosphohydrolase [Elusimicrobiota bacterium]